jgi:hypothetical protein
MATTVASPRVRVARVLAEAVVQRVERRLFEPADNPGREVCD